MIKKEIKWAAQFGAVGTSRPPKKFWLVTRSHFSTNFVPKVERVVLTIALGAPPVTAPRDRPPTLPP